MKIIRFSALGLLSIIMVIQLSSCKKLKEEREEFRRMLIGEWNIDFYSRSVYGTSGVLLGEDLVIDTGHISFYENEFGETDILLFRDDAGFPVDFFYWKPRYNALEIAFRENFYTPSIDFNQRLLVSDNRMILEASTYIEIDQVDIDYRLEMSR